MVQNKMEQRSNRPEAQGQPGQCKEVRGHQIVGYKAGSAGARWGLVVGALLGWERSSSPG